MSGRDPNDLNDQNDQNDTNDDIEDLKENVRKHKIRIEELEQQVHQLKSDRDCSTNEKRALENEVSKLKQKIKWLEDEVSYFSTKAAITDLKRKLQEKDAQIDDREKAITEKLKQMEQESAKKDTRIKWLEDEVRHFSTNAAHNDLKRELAEFKSHMQEQMQEQSKQMQEQSRQKDVKIGKMENKIRCLTEKCKTTETKLDQYCDTTDKLEKTQNMLYIGELCAKAMEAIYWEVLPVYFKGGDYKQPHLRVINTKIEELYQTKKDKREAHKRWEKLQAEKIDAELVDFMEEMLEERNVLAHPYPLNEKKLKKIASNIPGHKQQYFEKVIQFSKEKTPTLFCN